MADFEKMYYSLSGEITNIIEKMQEIQKEMEEAYLSDTKAVSEEKN